jgi:hypothetical protein
LPIIGNNPQSLAKIVAMSAAGLPQQIIADDLGVARTTIGRTIDKNALQTKVNEVRDRLLNQFLPTAADNIAYCVNSFKETKDKQIQYFGYKASEKVLESVGLFPSHAPSVLIQQVFNQQSIHVHPVIQGLLDNHIGGFSEDFEEENDVDK